MFRLEYLLTVVDEAAMLRLRESAKSEFEGLMLENTAKWNDMEATAFRKYTDSELEKNVVKKLIDPKPTKDNKYTAKFEAVLNPEGNTYLDGNTRLDVYDKMVNMTLKTDTFKVTYFGGIEEDREAAGLEYDPDRGAWHFTVRDGVTATITYDTRIVRPSNGTIESDGTVKVDYSNEITFGGYKAVVDDSQHVERDSEGFAQSTTIRLIKSAEDNKDEKLAGAEFQLFRWTGQGIPSPATSSEGWTAVTEKTDDPTVWVPVIRETKAPNGEAEFFGRLQEDGWAFDVDKYYAIKEIKAPVGFELDSYYHPFIVQYNSVDPKVEGLTVIPWNTGGKLPVKDKRNEYTEFNLKKVDAVSSDKVLGGAEFTLKPFGQSRTLEQTKETATVDGIVTFTKVYPGRYTVTETKAPDGYSLMNPVSFEVMVNADNSVTSSDARVHFEKNGQGVYTAVITNEEAKGKLILKKQVTVNSSDGGDPFGAESFSVSIQDDKTKEYYHAVSAEGTAAEKVDDAWVYTIARGGTLTFNNMVPGKYIIREYDNGSHRMSYNYRGFPYLITIDGDTQELHQTSGETLETLQNKNYGQTVINLGEETKEVVIDNKAKESTDVEIRGLKHLVGRNIKPNEAYTFELYNIDSLNYTANPTADQLKAYDASNLVGTATAGGKADQTNWLSFKFDKNNTQGSENGHSLHYTWADYWGTNRNNSGRDDRVWWYALKEKKTGGTDVTSWDENVYYIKVQLGPDHYGELYTNIYYYDKDLKSLGHDSIIDPASRKSARTADPFAFTIEFTNIVSNPGKKNLQVLKKVDGQTPASAGVFSFTLTAVNGAPMPSETETVARNDENGLVSWGEISFDGSDIKMSESKTYEYRITENDPPEGYTKDTNTYIARITVDKNADGVLTVHSPVYGLQKTELSETEFLESLPVFNNHNDYKPTEFTPVAKKNLLGGTLGNEQFTFQLVSGNGIDIIDEGKKNDADGNVTFKTLSYDQPGTYSYFVREVVPQNSNDSIIYDTEDKPLTVTVVPQTVDGRVNSLTASASYGGERDGIVFNNKQVADGKITFYAKKYVDEITAPKGTESFKFTALETTEWKTTDRYSSETTAVGEGGLAAFDEITYRLSDLGGEDEKTFTYRISEANNNGSLYEKDTVHANNHTVNVTVRKETDSNGVVSLKVESDDADNVFEFYNKSKETSTVIDVLKTMKGLPDANAEKRFTFTLYGRFDSENDAKAVTKRTELNRLAYKTVNVKNGDWSVTFNDEATWTENGKDKLTFKGSDLGTANSKTFWYVVTESGTDPNVHAAETEKIVSVTVSKNNGELNAVVNGELNTHRVFVNTYSVGKPVISVKKILEGRNITGDDKFTFELYKGESENNCSPVMKDGKAYTVIADTNGSAQFTDFAEYSLNDLSNGSFTEKYFVKEKQEDRVYVTNDTNVHEVDVTVSKVTDENGTDKVSIAYDYVKDENRSNGPAVFTNKFVLSGKYVIKGRKNLKGSDGKNMTLDKDQFTFELYDWETNELIESVKNNADGSFEFTPLVYDSKNMISGNVYLTNKEFKYYIVEKNAGDKINGVKYSDTVYKLTVNVGYDGGRKDGYDTEGTLYKVENGVEKSVRFGVWENFKEVVTSLLNGITGTAKAGEVTIEFENKYETEGSFFLQFKKSMAYWPANASFAFEVLEGDTLKNARLVTKEGQPDYGKVTLSEGEGKDTSGVFEFNYSSAGKHTYWIRENISDDADGGKLFEGIKYADPVEIKVDVSDDGNGNLVTKINDQEGTSVTTEVNPYTVTVDNTYTAEGALNLSGTKTLDNGTIGAGQYSVTVTRDVTTRDVTTVREGETATRPIEEVRSEDGATSWKWSYSDTYGLSDLGTTPTYHVSETKTDVAGVVYDTEEYDVVVTLTDDAHGKIIATPEITRKSDGNKNIAADVLDFRNRIPKKGVADIHAEKIVEGMNMTNDYTFLLTMDQGDQKGVEFDSEATNDGSDVHFSVSFNKAADIPSGGRKEYHFTISEKLPEGAEGNKKDGVSYDTESHGVKISVYNDPQKNELVPTVTYDDGKKPVFTNKYEANGITTVKIKKQFDDYDFPAEGFTFKMYDASGRGLGEGGEVESYTVKNKDDVAEFTEGLSFTQEDLKEGSGYKDSITRYYYIEEDDGGRECITYDKRAVLVKVVVKDNKNGSLSVEKYVTMSGENDSKQEGFDDRIMAFFESILNPSGTPDA